MDCNTPGFPILYYLRVSSNSCPLSQQCYLTILSSAAPSPIAFNLSQHRYFPMSWLFASGGQNIGASAAVLAMNIQDWFPLGLTDLISLQPKGLSRVFSSTTIWKHQFFQWIFLVDFLWNWLIWSPCSPRDSQRSSAAPQFKSINSLTLRLLYGPALTSILDYWKNYSFD